HPKPSELCVPPEVIPAGAALNLSTLLTKPRRYERVALALAPHLVGGSMGSLRERNRLLVVDALRRNGYASRSDLARLTGLSRTTVGSLVAELLAQSLVVEDDVCGERQAGRGRPPVHLRL